ncbi:MAG: Fe-S cluster assembly protein SufD [Rhodospirillales bacterium]|nr:Fe-S cluster assembly protein SufD [Rhodospirillales bacterium]
MTAPLPSGAAGFLARYAALRDVLPGDPALRDAAADAFRTGGFPGATRGRRSEAWKYTSLRPLADLRFQSQLGDASLLADDAITALLARVPTLDAPRIVFVDGAYHAELSTPPAWFARFAEQPDFGTLTWPDREPLVALNTMLAADGALLHVPEDTDAGVVELVHVSTDGAAAHPRHCIRLGANARLTVLDVAIGSGSYLHNPVTEVHVGAGATLTHARLQDEAPGAFHLATTYAGIAGDATYDSFTLTLGGRVARNEVHTLLAAPRATAHLNGAQLLTGSQHADFTSVVRHEAPSCVSRQTVKNVLNDHARGVFQGRIEVARVAQKTDGYQMNQALLLSPDAEIDSKPELEIFADDVKCSHGATVGELDVEQLFYLRSRGIPDAEARAILVRAFLAEALDAVTQETVRAALEASVERWWERQAA